MKQLTLFGTVAAAGPVPKAPKANAAGAKALPEQKADGVVDAPKAAGKTTAKARARKGHDEDEDLKVLSTATPEGEVCVPEGATTHHSEGVQAGLGRTRSRRRAATVSYVENSDPEKDDDEEAKPRAKTRKATGASRKHGQTNQDDKPSEALAASGAEGWENEAAVAPVRETKAPTQKGRAARARVEKEVASEAAPTEKKNKPDKETKSNDPATRPARDDSGGRADRSEEKSRKTAAPEGGMGATDVEKYSQLKDVTYMCGHNHNGYSGTFDREGATVCLAGGGGMISMYSVSEQDQYGAGNDEAMDVDGEIPSVSPLVSFKAHKRWISDVRFVHAKPGLLVSASDDGTARLWDMTKVLDSEGACDPLHTSDVLHDSGIFSLDERRTVLLTGSKDASVAMSCVRPDTIQCLRLFPGIHKGVIKCVRWHTLNTFGSCGNDKGVCVFDTRNGGVEPVIRLNDAHDMAINSLSFEPTNGHTMMTSSFDKRINVFDIRKPADLLFTISEHNSAKTSRTGIIAPLYLEEGRVIATPGEKQSDVYFFDARTGKLLHRTPTGCSYQPHSIFHNPVTGDLVATSTTVAYLMRPGGTKA